MGVPVVVKSMSGGLAEVMQFASMGGITMFTGTMLQITNTSGAWVSFAVE